MGEFNYAVFVPEGVQSNDIWDIGFSRMYIELFT